MPNTPLSVQHRHLAAFLSSDCLFGSTSISTNSVLPPTPPAAPPVKNDACRPVLQRVFPAASTSKRHWMRPTRSRPRLQEELVKDVYINTALAVNRHLRQPHLAGRALNSAVAEAGA